MTETTLKDITLRFTLVALMAVALGFNAVAAEPSTDGDSAVVYVTVKSDVDSDGDGLTDDVETALGCDPSLWDTDNDGIADGWEVWNAMDPRNPEDAEEDADGDGVLNYEEYALGTLPFELDSDGDGFWDGIEASRGTDGSCPASYPFSKKLGDADRNGRVDSIDIQLVINGVLGRPVPVPVNINGVGGVNALDIQAVVMAMLGSGR